MDVETLMKCTGARLHRAQQYAPFIEAVMEEYGITNPDHQAAFLANVGHESGGLQYTTELWGPTKQQLRYEPPSDLAQRLGNTQKGDGAKFKGHGLLQTTGRYNHVAAGQKLGFDGAAQPEKLAEPRMAARSAGLFWQSKNLGQFVDSGDFVTLVKRINGGLNGFDERARLYEAGKKALGVA